MSGYPVDKLLISNGHYVLKMSNKILLFSFMNKRIKIMVFGKVQGVFFRYSVKEKADKLDIKGFARNLTNGSVEIVAEGKEKDLNKLIDWAKSGPNSAKVEKIEISDETSLEKLSDFVIK